MLKLIAFPINCRPFVNDFNKTAWETPRDRDECPIVFSARQERNTFSKRKHLKTRFLKDNESRILRILSYNSYNTGHTKCTRDSEHQVFKVVIYTNEAAWGAAHHVSPTFWPMVIILEIISQTSNIMSDMDGIAISITSSPSAHLPFRPICHLRHATHPHSPFQYATLCHPYYTPLPITCCRPTLFHA